MVKDYLLWESRFGIDHNLIKANNHKRSYLGLRSESYTNNIVTTLSTDINTSDYIISVLDASTISSGSYITINDESMFVKSKSNNSLTVVRGSDSTPILNHVSGTEVKLITSQDNNLIEVGDDFGFSGSII